MLYSLLILKGIIERGLIYSILVIGIYIASKIIKFENMSIEGAFGLGGAISIVLLNYGINPFLTLLLTAIGGGLSGILTGVLHQKLNINKIMSGIIVTTGMFSIILKLATSHMILQSENTIFQISQKYLSFDTHFLMIISISLLIVFFMIKFLRTEIGILLYAVGDNPQLLLNISKNPSKYTLLGLFLSNAFAALSHGIFIQYMGYFSIYFSTGILVVGLAGMILSEIITDKFNYFILMGGVLYQIIIAITFELQIHPDWNKLITALLIVITLFIKQNKHANNIKRG